MTYIMHKRVPKCLFIVIVIFILVFTIASGSVFATQNCDTDIDTGIVTCNDSTNVYVTVETMCSIGRDGSGEHSGTLNRNSSTEIIGSNFTTVCNGPFGHSIYAVGFSNNEIGNTDLISDNDPSQNIKTDGEDSNWKMKLSSDGDNSYTIESFSEYSQIPSSYTRVAYYPYNNSGSSGSTMLPSYKITTSTSQATGQYTGKVKYTLIPTSYPLSKTIYDLKYMQDFAFLTSDQKDDVLESMITNNQYQLLDSRDDKSYFIAKLTDGNLWMTQNLDLYIDKNKTYTPSDTDIPQDWTPVSSTRPEDDHDWELESIMPDSYDPGDRCWNGIIVSDFNLSLDDITVPCDKRSNYHLGNYYNWFAATALEFDEIIEIFNTEEDFVLNRSICPAGWKLPGLDGEKSYKNLVSRIALSSGEYGNIHLNPVNFTYSGLYGIPSGESVFGAIGAYPANDFSFIGEGGPGGLAFSYMGDLDFVHNLAYLTWGTSMRCVLR